jgi:UDP-N-acetylmuramoylalanine--D-glutamate ligase
VTGYATARVLLDLGARVTVTEVSSSGEIEERAGRLRAAGAEVVTGGHHAARLEADAAVLSPGIAPDAPVAAALTTAGVPLLSEIELGYRLARCPLLAVTGTNGKTTTTTLLASMLSEAGIPSAAAGNIGAPLIEAVRRVPAEGAIAVEVSSFQLHSIRDFRARVAVILNIAEDHTDWHGSVDAYAESKARVLENQGPDDTLVVNADDPRVMAIATRARARVIPFSLLAAPTEGAGAPGDGIVWRGRELFSTRGTPLEGPAARQDALAAAAAALAFGVERAPVVRALEGFRPLPHRLAPVARAEGVTYIDDSKATNPHAALAAIAGLEDVVLIAGGRAKGIDLGPLAGSVPPVRAVVVLGEAAPALERVFDGLVPVERARSMSDAVARARRLAAPGGSVLLSPACASLDMYESYSARGDDFARAVRSQLREVEGE